MKILAFDTSSIACSVALRKDGDIKASHQIAPMQQAKLILPMINELLHSSSLALHELDAIAYGCGPGSFTGIRIATSVAQGLSYASKRPLIRLSSLAVMAQAAFMAGLGSQFLVAVDARTEQVYWAKYSINAQGYAEQQGEEEVCKPDAITLPPGTNWCGIGDGWEKYEQKLKQGLGFWPKTLNISQLPTAEALLTLAAVKLTRGEGIIAPSEAIPAYLR
jgi:tRNA threonylcarbamoyladenosine biosynthesis protein TsaB